MVQNLTHIQLPSWIEKELSNLPPLLTDTDKMNFVIKLSHQNVEKETGGPFAAAIFNMQTHELISIGVNVVTKSNASIAHAEIMAITLAQKKLNSFSLKDEKNSSYELITSAEPCAMCYGALLWSGIKRCVSGATAQDVESIGFDEGDKPENWEESLRKRNIDYTREINRDSAKRVLNDYYKKNGLIYNGTPS